METGTHAGERADEGQSNREKRRAQDEQKSGWTDQLEKRDVEDRIDQTDGRELPKVHHYTF